MEPQKENNRLLVITLIISIVILIGIVISGTYAFFTSTIKMPETDFDTQITGAKIEFSLTDKDGVITGENLIPGDKVTKTFQVTNSGSGTITYRLVWDSVINNFVNQDDLIVTLSDGLNEEISEEDNVTLPATTTDDTDLITGLKINSGETKNFTLTITYKETDADQLDDRGKNFSAVLKISD